MKLDEAKQILKNNGFILEDFDADEYEDLLRRYHSGHGRGDLTKKWTD